MQQQPDKLFREKLEGFSKPVPASAWSRIEAGLNKKKYKTFWLKIAASLLALAVAAILLWPVHTTVENDLIVKKNSSETNQDAEENKKESPQQSVIPQTEKSQKAVSPKKTTATSVRKQHQESRKFPAMEIPEEVITQEMVINEAMQEKIAEVEEPVATVLSNTTYLTEKEDGVTLVYTVEEVNAKYLDKKSLAEATSGEKKPSTLKKLLDKAYDLKNNQDPFGDLRQKKNEILALNFKSEKQRSQNK
jgi:hypothetical protein